MSSQIEIVILAGGQGTRFWPISRMRKPKQFLSISSSGESLIQATARRIAPLSGRERLWVVTNILHEPLIREHVPYAKILSEPIAKNTAASIGLAAMHLKARGGDPVMIILPADHAIKNEEILRAVFQKAISLAEERDSLVTIGVAPTSAHTGYGYIKKGRKIQEGKFLVSRFFEKPNLERAIKYYESGEYLWNSGMFVWRVSTILNAIETHMPELYQGLVRIHEATGTPQEASVLEEVFSTLDSVSIDFGILEHAKNCSVVVGEPFGWNDVGSWDAWAEHFEVDGERNLLYGDAVMIDAKNCVVHSQNRLIGVVGIDDLVVIDAGDALLVCPRGRVQDVRKVVEELKKRGRVELI